MMSNSFTIVIDRDIVAKYDELYFKRNPRARKSYFKNNWKNKRDIQKIVPSDKFIPNRLFHF